MTRLVHHFSKLGPLEQRILEALWARRDSTVRELLQADCRDLAYTTVMTTLDRLFKKGLLTRSEEGRAFRYATRFSCEELHRQEAESAVRQLFEVSSSSSLPLSFLVEVLGERDRRLLDELQAMVERRRRELAKRATTTAETVRGKEKR